MVGHSDDDLPYLAKVVRRARKALGLTQIALVEKSGVSKPVISTIENGHHSNLTASTAKRLAEALGIPVTDLTPHDESAQIPKHISRVRKEPLLAVRKFKRTREAKEMLGGLSSDEQKFLVDFQSIMPKGAKPSPTALYYVVSAFRTFTRQRPKAH